MRCELRRSLRGDSVAVHVRDLRTLDVGSRIIDSWPMETLMKWMAVAFAASAPLAPWLASAQGGDGAYCDALIVKYQTYIERTTGRDATSRSIDANLAIEQCKAGNTGAGIPVLEQKLRNARIDLPPRG